MIVTVVRDVKMIRRRGRRRRRRRRGGKKKSLEKSGAQRRTAEDSRAYCSTGRDRGTCFRCLSVISKDKTAMCL
jgi:hypothetical protein